jgi:hypothetical protein
VPYDTDWTNANDEALQKRVRVAMVRTATLIVGEAWTNATLGMKRHALGEKVLADGGLAELERFMFACVAGGAITPASTDTDIDNRLSAIWNGLAGVANVDN